MGPFRDLAQASSGLRPAVDRLQVQLVGKRTISLSVEALRRPSKASENLLESKASQGHETSQQFLLSSVPPGLLPTERSSKSHRRSHKHGSKGISSSDKSQEGAPVRSVLARREDSRREEESSWHWKERRTQLSPRCGRLMGRGGKGDVPVFRLNFSSPVATARR